MLLGLQCQSQSSFFAYAAGVALSELDAACASDLVGAAMNESINESMKDAKITASNIARNSDLSGQNVRNRPLAGFLELVAGAGFEPTTFGL